MRPLAERIIDKTSGDPHAHGGENSFIVVAFDPEDARFYAGITGQDVYDVTAAIIIEAAKRTLEAPPEEGGFTSPGALFDTRDFLASVDLDVVEA